MKESYQAYRKEENIVQLQQPNNQEFINNLKSLFSVVDNLPHTPLDNNVVIPENEIQKKYSWENNDICSEHCNEETSFYRLAATNIREEGTMMLNNKAYISFNFTGDKGKAECFIFKYIEVSYTLNGLINQNFNQVNQLWNELDNHFTIENFNFTPEVAHFILSRNAAGFKFLEDLECVANEIVTEIKSCTQKLDSIKEINLIVDGVY